MGFSLAALTSLWFLVRFVVAQLWSPGMSIALALLAVQSLVAMVGTYSVFTPRATSLTDEVRTTGCVAAVLVPPIWGYVVVFFPGWLPTAHVWIGCQIPMVVWLVASPRASA